MFFFLKQKTAYGMRISDWSSDVCSSDLTLEEGRHGGAFCEQRAAWLDAELAKDRAKPTYIVMHHPPIESGIEWMNTHPDEPWVAVFTDVVRRHPQVRGLICGNLHRSLTVAWEGRTLALGASTAPHVSPDLLPLDAGHPAHYP